MGGAPVTNISKADLQYNEAIRVVLERGDMVPTRAILRSSGKKISAMSVIDYGFRVNVADDFPLITTKRVSFSNVLRELLWFVSGSTNERELSKHGVNIWKEWAGADGELGPIYGAAWRRYEGVNKTVDQLRCAVEGVRAVVRDPSASVGNRLIVSAWDPTRLDEMGLPPCHIMFQLFVRGTNLDMVVYQRSGDLFLGVPYNLASYATLLHMIAWICDLTPRNLCYRFGNLHIYENHIELAERQLVRVPSPSPQLVILNDRMICEIDDFNFEDFSLVGYHPHLPIHAEVAV